MTKKVLYSLVAIVVIAGAALSLAGCSGKPAKLSEEGFFESYEDLTKEKGLDSYTLMREVLENLDKDKTHVITEYFSFHAEGVSMQSAGKNIIKADGDKTYKLSILVSKGPLGIGNANNASRDYHDGKDLYSINIENDKKLVPGEGEGENFFTVTQWPDYQKSELSADEVTEKLNVIKNDSITIYNTASGGYLSENHDTGVYTHEGLYYFTVTFDCGLDIMKTVHPKAYQNVAGAVDESKEMSFDDFAMDFVAEKHGDTFRVIKIRKHEGYFGTVAVFSMHANVKSVFDISYDPSKSAINTDDLLNLA